MKLVTFVLALALSALAQAPPTPEIRGIITDSGVRTPLAGATVTLYEFAPNEESVIVRKSVATTTTAPDGTFSIKPSHLGRFMVGVKKDGYSSGSPTGDDPLSIAEVDAKNPVQTVRMSLTRPGTLTGRVLDRDGYPIANLKVGIDQIHLPGVPFLPGAISAVTNAEGIFTSANLTPGPYIVRIAPQHREDKSVTEGEELSAFTEDAFKTIDQDVETSYWPGGLPTPDQVLPVSVEGGGIANAGTITIRKIPYYRAHVSYKGECTPRERWIFRIRPASAPASSTAPAPEHYASCHEESLLTGIAPGSYELAIWSGRDVDHWALVPFTIKDENIEIPLNFSQSVTITGRVSTPPGGPDLKSLGFIQVVMRASQSLPSNKPFAEVKDGLFTFTNVPWKSQWVSTMILDPNTYVKEIRYNGLPIRSPAIEATNGSTLDIVVDQGAAKLNVVLKEGDAPAAGFVVLANASLTELPPVRPPFDPFLFISEIRNEGPIALKNIPPGEYRIIAAPLAQLDQILDDETALNSRFQQAPKITLERGEQKSIELQLKP